MLQVDVGLRGFEIGHGGGVTKVVLRREGPFLEGFGLALRALRKQRDRLGMVRGVEEEAQRAQVVL